MTLKDIAKQLTTAVQTVPNLVQILRDGLEQATAGSTVYVTPVVTEGTKIATITVDGDNSDLYAPNITPLHIYDEDEHLVGRWFHDNIAEDVYEKTFSLDNISTTSGSPTELIPSSYFLLDVKPTGIYTVSDIPYVFDDLIFVNSVNTDSFNLRLGLRKGTTYYTIFKEGSGTVSDGILTLRYVKRT